MVLRPLRHWWNEAVRENPLVRYEIWRRPLWRAPYVWSLGLALLSMAVSASCEIRVVWESSRLPFPFPNGYPGGVHVRAIYEHWIWEARNWVVWLALACPAYFAARLWVREAHSSARDQLVLSGVSVRQLLAARALWWLIPGIMLMASPFLDVWLKYALGDWLSAPGNFLKGVVHHMRESWADYMYSTKVRCMEIAAAYLLTVGVSVRLSLFTKQPLLGVAAGTVLCSLINRTLWAIYPVLGNTTLYPRPFADRVQLVVSLLVWLGFSRQVARHYPGMRRRLAYSSGQDHGGRQETSPP